LLFAFLDCFLLELKELARARHFLSRPAFNFSERRAKKLAERKRRQFTYSQLRPGGVAMRSEGYTTQK
jgi:hypothetical protein